ncbi:MAG TPA: acyl-CoA synthetase [Polyangiales bacterium]|nr:acyl-CoA synthetase [Polyangiales bacterium]
METLENSWVERAQQHGDACAIVDVDGRYSYAELLDASARIASGLLDGARDLDGARVCFLIAPSFRYVATQWAIFRAGGVAVPLCVSHPEPELAHVIDDAVASIVIADAEFDPKLRPLTAARGLRHLNPNALLESQPQSLPLMAAERPALLIYTSGTTGKPKGAITTHAILDAQMRSIVQAWEMTAHDRLLHVLPLHHLHGILNALCAPLYAGACVELAPRFDPISVLERFAAEPALTLFMAVPTIYAKLVAEWPNLAPDRERAIRQGLSRLRLMISGSAALPVSLLARVRELSGHVLLERYGMTEIGMALGNPLHGERRAGSVGVPFPEVEARIVDERGVALGEDVSGELQIRGPNVFAGYWNKPDATRASFTEDGFFRTGDVAIRERGYYRLLGRESVDIIKTGGFKVSALEIEESLREHPAIAEVAIVGVADPEWGERVAAALVLQPGAALTLEELRAFGKARLAPYKVPSLLRLFDALPRNALGKVQKPPLKSLFAANSGND